MTTSTVCQKEKALKGIPQNTHCCQQLWSSCLHAFVVVNSFLRTDDNVALPAFARLTTLPLRAGQQSIYISCATGPQQQTCSSGFADVGPCWDRQTGRLTN